MPHTRQRPPYPPEMQQRLNPPGLGHNTLQADQLSRIEAGIIEIKKGQQRARDERQKHARTIQLELDDLTQIARNTSERVDTLEQDHRNIRTDQHRLRLEIEQRFNRAMSWIITLLVTGLLGLLWAVLKRGVS